MFGKCKNLVDAEISLITETMAMTLIKQTNTVISWICDAKAYAKAYLLK